MKKLLSVILLVVLLFTTAFAIGTVPTVEELARDWISITQLDDGGFRMEFFSIKADGTLAYMNRTIYGDGSDSWGREFFGSWTLTSKGAHLVYGNNADAYVTMQKGWMILEIAPGAYVIYSPIPKP